MTLALSAELQARLAGAADEGLDLACVVRVWWPQPVGVKWFSTRPVQVGAVACAPLLASWPETARAPVPGVLQAGAPSETVTLELLNTPEGLEGTGEVWRVGDLLLEAPLEGAWLDVGIVDVRDAGLGEGQVRWDNSYRVDRVERTAHRVMVSAMDAMLLAGEKAAGWPVGDAEFPAAPPDSYGQVRGPVWGKVEGLPLIPVDVGQAAGLAEEIDEWDDILEISGGLAGWPASGFAWVDDELVYYPAVDVENRRLGKAGAPVQRGVGWPATTPAAHAAGARVREASTGVTTTLAAALTAGATTMTLAQTAGLPHSGVLVVGGEAIHYFGKQTDGKTLTPVSRGRPMPTFATAHNAGAVVRTMPMAGEAQRFRYLVAAGAVSAVTNVRGVDEQGNEVPVEFGAAVTGQITTGRGRIYTVVDLSKRPRLDRYSTSESAVPAEWIKETDGRFDPATGFALVDGFKRWRVAASTSAPLVAQAPLVLDPLAGTQAAYLKSQAGENVMGLVFNAGWDGALDPRVVLGRFREARARVQVQYSMASTLKALVEVWKDGVVVKSAAITPPRVDSSPASQLAVAGRQTLPRSRWTAQKQTRPVPLRISKVVIGVDPIGRSFWCSFSRTAQTNMYEYQGNGPNALLDGNPLSYACGCWNPVANEPSLYPFVTAGNPLDKDLELTANFGKEGSADRVTGLALTVEWPTDVTPLTDVRGMVYLYSKPYAEGTATWSGGFAAGLSGSRVTTVQLGIPATLTLGQMVSVRVVVYQWTSRTSNVGRAVTIRELLMEAEIDPQIQGAGVDTNVDGTNFFVDMPAGSVPSAAWWQPLSLGRTARDWGRATGRDPWEFFGGNGVEIRVTLPTGGGALQLALADCELELEYSARETVYDLPLVADVDGRVGLPVGGMTTAVLENPVDVLAELVENGDFYGLTNMRDESWAAARAAAGHIRVSRAVTRETTVRELAASLCHEARLVLLYDQGRVGVRWRREAPQLQQAVALLGDEGGATAAVVQDAFPVAARVDEFRNEVAVYYRRNYRNEHPRAVVELRDDGSVAGPLGLRREPMTWDWHQSARGYAGGFDEQKSVVTGLARYVLGQASHLWDYATVEVPLSGGEGLQRYDDVALNRPRAGLWGVAARVVGWERMARPLRNRLVLQIPAQSAAYYWRGLGRLGDLRADSYVRLTRGGRRMEFVLRGRRAAVLTEDGDLLLAGDLVVVTASQALIGYQGWTGVPENARIRWRSVGLGWMDFYLPLRGEEQEGEPMHVVQLVETGDLKLYPNFDEGEYPWPLREVVAGANLGNEVVPVGITEHAPVAGETGEIRFACGGRVQMAVGRGELRIRGGVHSRAI